MKLKNTILVPASIFVMGVTQVNAATITQSVDNIDWNLAMWGGPAAAPTNGNDYETALGGTDRFRIAADGASSTFTSDGSLTAVSGTRALIKSSNGTTAAMSGQFILAGGRLSHGPNATSSSLFATGGFVVTGTGSLIDAGQVSDVFSITGGLSGDGDFTIDNTNATKETTISFDVLGAYSGDIYVEDNMTLSFESDADFSASGGGVELLSGGQLNLDLGLTVTFGSGKLSDDGVPIANGTYTGAALDALGASFANNGGTLIIVPEPSSTALLGLAGLALIMRRRK